MADDRWGHVKWLPGTAGDQAWCRRDSPSAAARAAGEIRPRKHGKPQQCQPAGLRASRMSVCQMLCMENEQIQVQKQDFIQLDGPCRL